MPVLKSPGKILILWNKAKADYLAVSELKNLEPAETAPFKKSVQGLTRLRKLAQVKTQGGAEDTAEFTSAREHSLEWMGKFRKLFKPHKTQAKVKKYYQTVCRLILCVEKLEGIEQLDASEDVKDSAVDDLDADALDQREDGQAAPEAASQPAPTPETAPPQSMAEQWRQRQQTLQPKLLEALKTQQGDVSQMRSVFAFAQEKAAAGDYARALQGLTALDKLLQASNQPTAAPANGAVPPAAALKPQAEFKSRLEKLQPEYAAALARCRTAAPDKAAALEGLYTQVGIQAKALQFTEALQTIAQLEKQVKDALTTTAATGAAAENKPLKGMAAWQAAHQEAVNALRQAAEVVATIVDPDAIRAAITLRSVAAQLTPNPSTPQQIASLEKYLTGDDIIAAVEETPPDIGTIRLRAPLLAALAQLKS